MVVTSIKKSCRRFLRMLVRCRLARAPLRALASAGFLSPQVWKRLPVEGAFCVSLPNGNLIRYSTIASDSIGRALFWRGLNAWHAETLEVFYRLPQGSRIVLDIGANSGVFTLLACAANSECRVIAFEPVPRVYERLVQNIRLNSYSGRCQLREEAVSDTVGLANVHVPYGDMPTSASLHSVGFRGAEGTMINVKVTTVDAVCSQCRDVDLVKIDVEGFEEKVLEGMRKTVARMKPTIIVECNPDGPYVAVESILSASGYRFYHLSRQGPVAARKIIPDESEQFRDYLCTVHDNWEKLR